MSLRAIGSLLTQRFWPCATPRTAPTRALHSSLRGLPIDGGAAGVAAAAFAAGVGGTLTVQYYFTARKKPFKVSEEEMKPRFENWMKMNSKTYRDEEEKAMRFEVFKANVRWIESLPPSSQEMLLPENYFADFRKEELPGYQCCVNSDDLDNDDDYSEDKFVDE